MKKQTLVKQEITESMLPEYGRRKLLMYADSIRELAATFQEVKKESTPEYDNDAGGDRKDYIWQRRMTENKEIIAEHLQEIAQIMIKVAMESKKHISITERSQKKIIHTLKEVGIQVKNMDMLENDKGRLEFVIEMQSMKNDTLSVEEIGDLLSVGMNIHFIAAPNNPFFIRQEWQTFYYMEESDYYVLTGMAKAIKESEKISGDSYSFFDAIPGSLTALLSDGMGSGDKANNDSAMIIELMEKFLEADFHKEVAIQMISSFLIAATESNNMSTLDICEVDLYSAACEFIKIGSSCSYIKREHMVERISAGNLPLGIFHKPDMEIIKRQLIDGDYIIMISDGILDALAQGIGEDMLSEVIGGTSLTNPHEMANAILNFCIHQSRGAIRDDMTVLVIGIWKREDE